MEQQTPQEAVELFGDHPVLDFLNTVMTIDGQLVERWRGDHDVYGWIESTLGTLVELPPQPGPGLLRAALSFREELRRTVQACKEGGHPDLSMLNEVLAHAPGQLVMHEADGKIWITKRYAGRVNDALLAPIAEAAAQLVSEERFKFVKRCENPDCTLWFLDKSKSHQRRWCSMSLCGNRHKVTTFRRRKANAE